MTDYLGQPLQSNETRVGLSEDYGVFRVSDHMNISLGQAIA